MPRMNSNLRRYAFTLPLVALCLAAPPAPALAVADDEITITVVGDTGYSRNSQPVEPDGIRRGAFQTWAETTSAIDAEVNGDLNFMNVETVVTDRNDLTPDLKEQGAPFNFRTHPNGVRHLVSRGFNLLSLANNHSMDYGLEGLKETLKHVGALQSERLAVAAGLGMNSEQASRPQRVSVKGAEIAFAATGIVTNNLERHRAGPNKPGQSAYRFDDDYAEVRRRLVAASADYRILSIHYGEEGRVRADAKQFADFRGLAAQKDGIDLIIGHHAHVVRGVEIAGQVAHLLRARQLPASGYGRHHRQGRLSRLRADGPGSPEEGGGRQAQAACCRGYPRHRYALSPATAHRQSRGGAHLRAELSRFRSRRRARGRLHPAAQRHRALLSPWSSQRRRQNRRVVPGLHAGAADPRRPHERDRQLLRPLSGAL